jgi:hypothetical protein
VWWRSCHVVLRWLCGVAVAVALWRRQPSCHVVLRWLHDMAWRSQSHGLTVAVAVGGGGGRVVSRWLHGMAVAGGHMAQWWSRRLRQGGVCGGRVHGDAAHAVTRAG